MFFRLLKESFLFALHAIIVNKLRTFLSLLGITIGIFAIITVFTIFDSMESAIRKNIESLGSNVLFIQKWPWSMGGEYPWWKYWTRPEPSLEDLREIQKRSLTTEASAFMFGMNRTLKYRNNAMEEVIVTGVTHDFNLVMPVDIDRGRYFTQSESSGGRNVAIIGTDVATNLFRGEDPLGKEFRVFGRKVSVIGILKKEGQDMFGNSSDKQILMPANYMRGLFNLDNDNISTTIVVKAKPKVSNEEMKDEMTGILRSARKLKPKADDSFAINETDLISKGFDQIFAVIAMVGWIIGGFSLLVGGFGIANIMFVSVRERTQQIGIQKSLGAKRWFILFEFLFESVFLSLFGGIFGLLLVFLGALLISTTTEMGVVLTAGNIFLGLGVSFFIGLVSGIIPAWIASRLDPVVAIRSTG